MLSVAPLAPDSPSTGATVTPRLGVNTEVTPSLCVCKIAYKGVHTHTWKHVHQNTHTHTHTQTYDRLLMVAQVALGQGAMPGAAVLLSPT